ncbi:sugar phosphate nucleotidyltransferase [Varibaculum cambriense]|uniref:mannose-1-phosphate guanylyltransferase n=1 Tax=Varibaculum cambriense TaxID=184870 RepID=UPI00242B093F|nr:sugar phosphate nucleotidyltransferase [Varibaculum cambriense]
MMNLHVIVPAGGPGSRLWPLSRAGKPKFLLDLLGEGRSLLQATVDRLAPLTASLTVVTGTSHAGAVAAQNLAERLEAGAKSQYRILEEPSRKNSLGAIAWAAARLQQKYGPVITGSFAADHAIKNVPVFRSAVAAAIKAAADGKIVTIGIAPTHPSTAYGYICASDKVLSPGNDQPPVLEAQSFKEKPGEQQARSYLETGGYFWNAGMFVFSTEVFLSHLATLLPSYYETVQKMVRIPPGSAEFLDLWESLPSYPIDTAIAEPVASDGGVAVVAAENFGWSDVGDFASLHQAIAGDNPQNSIVRGSGETQLRESPGAFVDHDGQEKLVVLGIPNAVVIRRGDVTLVTTAQHAQQLGDLAAEQGELR